MYEIIAAQSKRTNQSSDSYIGRWQTFTLQTQAI
jgi:hypothetical protein